MLRSHHLCVYSNIHREKTYEVRTCGVSGKVCAGVYGVDSIAHVVITLNSDVSLCLTLGAAPLVDR